MRKGTEEKVKLARAHSLAIHFSTLKNERGDNNVKIKKLQYLDLLTPDSVNGAHERHLPGVELQNLSWKRNEQLYCPAHRSTLMPARISLINLILWSFAFNCLSSKVSPRLLGNKMKWALTIGEQNNLTCLPKGWEEWPRPEQQGLPGGEIRKYNSKLKENFHIQEWKVIAIPRQQFQEVCREDQDRARAQWDRWSRRRRRAQSQPVSERRLGSDLSLP